MRFVSGVVGVTSGALLYIKDDFESLAREKKIEIHV